MSIKSFGNNILLKEGRYTVKLPFKESHPVLPDNFELRLRLKNNNFFNRSLSKKKFIEIENNNNGQRQTCSNYKHHNTMTILIAAAAANSTIIFLSKAFGGSISE